MQIDPTARPLAAGPPSSSFQPALEVYSERDGALQLARRTGDPATGDTVVDTAYEHAIASLSYLNDKLGLNGWDGKGTPLKVIANSSTFTHWDSDEGTMYLSADGDGGTTPSAFGADIVMHELGHGVATARNEDRVPWIGNERLHQMLANSYAMAFDADDWKLGEDVYAAWRVYDYSDLKSKLSDPYSAAMYRMGEAVGRETMMRVVHEATPDLRPEDGVDGTAAKTVAAAERLGLTAGEVAAISDAWRAGGEATAPGVPPTTER